MPLGRREDDLVSCEGLAPPRAQQDGFVDFPAAEVHFTFGTAFVSEWTPDKQERAALVAGARLRVLTLGKHPLPLKVGVATSMPGDTAASLDDARLTRIAKRLVQEVSGKDWHEMDPMEQAVSIKQASDACRIVYEELCR